MHFVGIGGGVSLTLFAALARAVLTTMELNADGSCSLTMKELYTTDKGKRRARYALGSALLAALAALGFLVAFMVVLNTRDPFFFAATGALGTHHDRRAMCIISAEINAFVSA